MKLSKKKSILSACMAILTAFTVLPVPSFASGTSKVIYGSFEVKGAKKFGPEFRYDYRAHVDVEVDENGRIVRVSDDTGKTENSIETNSNVMGGHFPHYNKPYWKKFVDGDGFSKYAGKTLEEVKNMDIGTPGNAGVDAVSGATAASLAVKRAVVHSFELDEAKSTLSAYKDGSEYRLFERKQLRLLIAEGKQALDEASTTDDLEGIVQTYKGKIDALKTSAQYEEEKHYTVDAALYPQGTTPSSISVTTPSMANMAMNSIVSFSEEDAKALYELSFKPLKISNPRGELIGNVTDLWVMKAEEEIKAELIEKPGEEYDKTFLFSRDDLREELIRVKLSVDIMQSMPGMAKQEVALIFNWNSLREIPLPQDPMIDEVRLTLIGERISALPKEEVLEKGTTVTVTVAPNPNQDIKSFIVNGEDKLSHLINNQYQLTLEENTVIKVEYAKKADTPTPPIPPTPPAPPVTPTPPTNPGQNKEDRDDREDRKDRSSQRPSQTSETDSSRTAPTAEVQKEVPVSKEDQTPSAETKNSAPQILTFRMKSSTKKADQASVFIEKGRAILPLRTVAESLGFQVTWNKKSILLTNGDLKVELPLNSKVIKVGDKVYTADIAPIVRDGRTYLSISNLAKALGLKVGEDIVWNNQTKELSVKKSQK